MAFRFKRRAYTHTNSSIRTLVMTGSTGLSDATVGHAYAGTFTADGGVPPYQAFTAIGVVPAGLTLSTSGDLSGTPSTTVVSTFSVEVRDAVGSTARASYRLQVISSGASAPPALSIQNSTNAPQGVVNSAYSLQINSTGGVPPYGVFTLVSGSLSPGLSMTASGAITGTPSTTGASTFTVQATDAAGSTVSQSFRLNVVSSAAASDTSGQAYFNNLRTHPNFYRGFPLNSQSSIDSFIEGAVPSSKSNIDSTSVWTYIWPNDGYVDAQDACKLRIVPNSTLSKSDGAGAQLRFPIGLTSGSIFVTWDFYYGAEWHANAGNVGTFKAFQVSDGTSSGDTKIYCECRVGHNNADGTTNVAVVDLRGYGMSTQAANANFVPGLIAQGSYTPTGQGALAPQTYPLKPAIWTRYWLEMNLLHPSSQFTEWNSISSQALSTGQVYRRVSLWVADEVTDPQRVFYRVPWRVRNPWIAKFWFEFDTSTVPSSNGSPTGLTGELTGYGRHVLMLKDATISESDTAVFQRP